MEKIPENLKKIPLSGPDITSLEKQEVLEVLDSRHLSQGKKVEKFESLIKNYIGSKHAIAVNSGTSGLHLIVKSLGLKEGDEVITTPFSFIASSNCLLMEKVKPVFVDVDEKTFNLDSDLIEEKINENTKAILVVHIFGHPANMEKINEIAKKHNLYVIEDACEAIGAEYKNKRVGNFSDASVFAFYPNKQLTTGEGGMILTNNDNIARLCKSMRNQGRNETGEWLKYERLGYNYRLDEMSSALGVAQMMRIEEILKKRQKVVDMYLEKLKDISGVIVPYVSNDVKMSWLVFTIRVDEKIRNNVLQYLQDKGIGCRNYFPSIHLEPFYKELFGYKKGDFPISEKISNQTINLPFYNNLKEEDIKIVVGELNNAINSTNE
jgi:perosamine synthetase